MSINSNNQGLTDSGQDFKFDVFISYRHSELDSAAAAYLHKALENYKIPKEIQQKIGKKRINRVFRDEEEMGASSDLFTEIENSIKDSEYLVVILSPRYKESKWCLKEIESFLKYHSRDNILAVIIEGEPYDVFPDILLEDGEPLALDLRASDKKEMLKLAKERLQRLVAPILGCTYDELYQRHRVARMRRIAVISGLITTVSLIFGTITIKQNIEIKKNFIAKQENQSKYLAYRANELLNGGDRETALLVALEALPKSSQDDSRPYVADARIALENALYTYNLDYYYNIRPIKRMKMDSDGTDISDYNQDEDILMTVDQSGYVYLWDGGTGTLLHKIKDYVATDAKLAVDNNLLIKTKDHIYCINYTNGSVLWQWEYPQCDSCYSTEFEWDYNISTGILVCTSSDFNWDYNISFTPDWKTEYNYYISDSHRIHIIDTSSGNSSKFIPQDTYQNIPKNQSNRLSISNISISPDGKYVALQYYDDIDCLNYINIHNLTDGTTVYSDIVISHKYLNSIHWTENNYLISVYTDDPTFSWLGTFRNPFTWHVDCHNVEEGKKLWSITEKSISIDMDFNIQSFEVVKSDINYNCIGITAGNVFVTLDRDTGHIYSRIEDRSKIVLAEMLPSKAVIMIMTENGYVFATNPIKDIIWDSMISQVAYSLDLNNITQVQRYNEKTYLFDESSIYWYQDTIDRNYTFTDLSIGSVGFADNKQYMWIIGSDPDINFEAGEEIHLYDVNTKEKIWEDDITYGYDSCYTAVIVNDKYLVYPSVDPVSIKVYDIETATVTEYPVANIHDSQKICVGAINTQHILIPTFSSKACYENSIENVIWIKDITTGEDIISLSGKDIVDVLNCADEFRSFSIKSVFLSGDSNYLLTTCKVNLRSKKDNMYYSELKILVWDVVNNCWVALPQEIYDIKLSDSYYYNQDGWIMPGTSLICIYGDGGIIKIIDISNGQVLHTLDFGAIGSKEISFTPDGDHIILQDSDCCLKIYNWRKGEYVKNNTVPEYRSLEFEFYDNGNILSAEMDNGLLLTSVTKVYERKSNSYELQNTISYCIACNGTTTVISDDRYSRFYPYYTFDQLVEMARDILGDRQLTEAERQTYLID